MKSIKQTRKQLYEDFPTRYTIAFPVSQWACDKSQSQGIVELCNTGITPYRYSVPGWLLNQLGVPSKDLCVVANEPGVVYGSHRVPYRFLEGLPRELAWWDDTVDVNHFTNYTIGGTSVKQIPDYEQHGLPAGTRWYNLLVAINDMPWGLTRGGRASKLTLEWRAFWLREAIRVGGSIGFQFHEDRGHAS